MRIPATIFAAVLDIAGKIVDGQAFDDVMLPLRKGASHVDTALARPDVGSLLRYAAHVAGGGHVTVVDVEPNGKPVETEVVWNGTDGSLHPGPFHPGLKASPGIATTGWRRAWKYAPKHDHSEAVRPPKDYCDVPRDVEGIRDAWRKGRRVISTARHVSGASDGKLPLPWPVLERMADLLDEGRTNHEAAAELGCSTDAVAKYARAWREAGLVKAEKKGRLTKKMRAKIRRLWRAGHGTPEIARRVGCSMPTVRRYVRRFSE